MAIYTLARSQTSVPYNDTLNNNSYEISTSVSTMLTMNLPLHSHTQVIKANHTCQQAPFILSSPKT